MSAAPRVVAARRALLAAAAALPACATVPGTGPAIAAPTLRIGERWRYRIVDALSGRWIDEPQYEIVALEPRIRVRVTDRRSADPFVEEWASPWVALSERLEDGVVVFAAPVAVIPAGDASDARIATTYVDPRDGIPLRWTQQVSVGRAETVEVPAGRFDCLRVSRVVAFQHPEASRGNATRSETLWYAPSIGRWVQRRVEARHLSPSIGGRDAASVGEAGVDLQRLWQLTAWLPAPTAR